MDTDELLGAVRDAFAVGGGDHPGWPDPHPDRQVDEDEYSRISDPGKHRVVTARTAVRRSTCCP